MAVALAHALVVAVENVPGLGGRMKGGGEVRAGVLGGPEMKNGWWRRRRREGGGRLSGILRPLSNSANT